MAMKDPTMVANKWKDNLTNSTTAMTNGVNAVTVAPTQLAAAQQNAYVAGVQRAATSGKWKRGLQRVSLTDWQTAMINKGVPRIATGASEGQPKMQSFMQQFLPYLQQGVNALSATPRGTLEQNIARATAMIKHNANFKRQGS